MNLAAFEVVRKEFMEMEEALLGVKGGEYASEEDRLSNFREISEWMDMPPEVYCMCLILKHVNGVKKAIISGKTIDNWCWETKSGEGLKQRIADVRNYMLLLAAILEEKHLISPGSTDGLRGEHFQIVESSA